MREPTSASCSRLAQVMGISHDRVNRVLLREAYEPKDLFNEAKGLLNLVGGTLSVDDSVLDQPYSQRLERVSYFGSGQHHRVVKGLKLITLYYTAVQGRSVPVNYRVYDTAEHQSKNEYFRELLVQVLAWGLQPEFMTGDSGYSCGDNLKRVRHHRMRFGCAVESNRRVSPEKGQWIPGQQLDIPQAGRQVWWREFGEVNGFRTRLKDQLRHSIVFLPDTDAYPAFGQEAFQKLHHQQWHSEQYHRMIKQVCHSEHFQVRGQVAIRNHIFAALCSYVHRQRLQITELIINAYRWQRDLYKDVVAAFVSSFISGQDYLNPQLRATVNA